MVFTTLPTLKVLYEAFLWVLYLLVVCCGVGLIFETGLGWLSLAQFSSYLLMCICAVSLVILVIAVFG